jgi:hypothetical protein
MRIRILRQTSISGQPARVGDVVEANDRDARLLIASGKAEPAPVVQDLEPIPAPRRTRKPRT